MAEEVKNVETQAAPTSNETPATAPREDFDTMTIEELTKYVETPLERVSQPNEKAMNDKCEAIDKEISGCFARMEELKIERQMISEGFRIERVRVLRSLHE